MDRLKGLGNAIVPQVAAEIIAGIAAIEFEGAVAGASDARAAQQGLAAPRHNKLRSPILHAEGGESCKTDVTRMEDSLHRMVKGSQIKAEPPPENKSKYPLAT